jgi:hypothetical protein
VAALAIGGGASCGLHARGGSADAARDGVASPVELRARQDHPSLSLVARDGDPFSAVAVAVAHDLGGMASVWLGALIEDRMNRALPSTLEPRATGSGFVLRARVDSREQAGRLATSARDALGRPFTEAEIARAGDRVRAGPGARTWASAADRAVGECSGELGQTGPPDRPTAASVERWRTAVFSSQSVAFSAVGRRDVLESVASALRAAGPWPTSHALQDPWPAADLAGATPADGRSLTLALRVEDAARALEAARALGARGSPLVLHLTALEPSWRVERVLGTSRPRGACLRIDLSVNGATLPSSRAAPDVAALALDEATRALAEASGSPFSLDSGLLEATDPRDAAAIAAWRALGGIFEPGAPRAFVSYGSGGAASDGASSAATALSEARARRSQPSLEVRQGNEQGQGELWLLLASPCATATESASDAGVAALTIRALALRAADAEGVHLEPWISSDGVGLLAHGPRLGAGESATAQARRVAGALGRALAGTQIGEGDVATARLALEAELLPETEPLWPVALEGLAPGRPSLLDPRGTWQSIANLSTHAAETERRALVRGGLRLAALTNGGATQVTEAERALERWLRPERSGAVRCGEPPRVEPRPGDYEVTTSAGAQPSSRALVAVALPPTASGQVPPEAEWTVHLLNRPGGWLDRAVRVTGLAVHAEASLLGGGDAAALTVEVVSTEDKARGAASQVRALFARLAEGAATSEDLTTAVAESAQESTVVGVDPRRRLVRMWLGRAAPGAPDLQAFRRFHHNALAAERHVVVVTRRRP